MRPIIFLLLLFLPGWSMAGYYKGLKSDLTTETVKDGKVTAEKTPIFSTAELSVARRNVAEISDTVALVPGAEKGSGYLGKDAAEVVTSAMKGNEDCKVAVLDILYTTWTEKVAEPAKGEPTEITRRGSLREWVAAGKPERTSEWVPGVVIAGHGVPVIDHADVERLIK